MASTDSEHINYYRTLSLTFEASSKTLQLYLRHHYRSKGFRNFAEFLSHIFHFLFFLWNKSPFCACGERRSQYYKGKPILTDVQWNVLFQEAQKERSKCGYIPKRRVEIESIDVTLSAFILIHAKPCKTDLSSEILTAIGVIREQRNTIMHRTSAQIDDAEFNKMWTSTEHAIMNLAKTLPEQEYAGICGQVKSIRHRLIDDAESARFLTLLLPIFQV